MLPDILVLFPIDVGASPDFPQSFNATNFTLGLINLIDGEELDVEFGGKDLTGIVAGDITLTIAPALSFRRTRAMASVQSVRITSSIRTRSVVAALATAERLNATTPAELTQALAVPVESKEEVGAVVNGEGIELTALRILVMDLQRTTTILIALSAFLVPAAAISLCALLFMWRRRREMERRAIEQGTRNTLAGLAKRNALEIELSRV